MLRKCAYCRGKGTPQRSCSPCPVCNGAGQVDMPENTIKCAMCEGKGHTFCSTAPCEGCGGTGRQIPQRYG